MLLLARASLAFSGVYAVVTAIALVGGAALPTTALIKWTGLGTLASRIEFAIPFAILLGVLLGKGGQSMARLRASGKWEVRFQEMQLARFLRNWGICLLIASMVLSVSIQWSGFSRPEDLRWASLGGIVPLSDARGYFENLNDWLRSGRWSTLASGRPMAAAFHSALALAGNHIWSNILLLQCLLLSLAIYVSCLSVTRWRGVWAGLAYAALMLAVARDYAATFLTEPLGFFLALLAVPLFVDSWVRGSTISAAAALGISSFALLVRMGAAFFVPAICVWIVAFAGKTLQRKAVALASVVLVLASVWLIPFTVGKLYSDNDIPTGGNFAYVACGLSIGTTWSGCLQRYPDLIDSAELGAASGARHTKAMNSLYTVAVDKYQIQS